MFESPRIDNLVAAQAEAPFVYFLDLGGLMLESFFVLGLEAIQIGQTAFAFHNSLFSASGLGEDRSKNSPPATV
jgi:hypothetical protein